MGPPARFVSPVDLDFSLYDEVIDVRTPTEHALDHLPGALPFPVLSGDQHAEVGTLYKQNSPFEAKKRGAALVSANIAQHINRHFLSKPKDYRPLLYCWRGGQRSQALATVLGQVGWRVDLVEGGYKAFRRHVISDLANLDRKSFRFRMLVGLTGSGKTHVLQALQDKGQQVLNLEAAANHRGSLLGQIPGQAVMNQKAFETRIWHNLRQTNLEEVIWVEGESAKIGKVFIPQPLFSMLKAAPTIEMQVPIQERVKNIIDSYPHWINQKAELFKLLHRFRARYGTKEFEQWRRFAEEGAWSALVERLLTLHYDPSYQNSRQHTYGAAQETRQLARLDGTSIQRFVDQLIEDERAVSL